ncbi:MAG: TonB-dependent receptor, partial [Acidobacteriaceae bacterium]|nr:TonB-dependent receptor [Acidobacteriaceae bacterium]
QVMEGTRGLRRTDLGFYIQDDYKLSSNLTINVGLRYENYLGYPWTEVDNRMYSFLPSGNVVQAGSSGVPRSGVSGRDLNLMPRVGLAYRISTQTVVRAAYGIFYSAPQIGFGYNIAANPPELISTAFTNSQFDFTDAIPASAGFSRPAQGSVLGSTLYAVNPNEHMPYTQQWNFGLQHQLTPHTLITASYVGTAATHLQGIIDVNQPVAGLTPIAKRRPYPEYQDIYEVANVDTSRYHALQVGAEQRLSHGLSLNMSYTWSHALDYASFDSTSGGTPVMDTYNRRLDYGNSDYDIRHRFVASTTYLLPFKATGPLRYAIEGWQINAILNLYTGLPFTVQSATNTLNNGSSSRAELIGPGDGSLPSEQRTLQHWFNTAAFSAPPALQFGDAGRNTLRGPGTKELDLSAFKNFYFSSEKTTNLQLRAEAFNVTNTPQFNNPISTVGAPGVGAITSAGSPYTLQRLSREVQLAVKLYF